MGSFLLGVTYWGMVRQSFVECVSLLIKGRTGIPPYNNHEYPRVATPLYSVGVCSLVPSSSESSLCERQSRRSPISAKPTAAIAFRVRAGNN